MRPKNPTPSYLLHRQSGRARAVWTAPDGKRREMILPGRFNSEESKAAYGKVVAEVATSPTLASLPANSPTVSMNELMAAYLEWRKTVTPTDRKYVGGTDPKFTIRTVRSHFGSMPVGEFGPRCLKQLREVWVREGLSRKVVNGRVGTVRRIVKWGTSEEIVPVEVWQRLTAVDGLRAGQTEAPEREPVRPAIMADVEKVLGYLTPTVRALVVVQLHSGARAGELVRMRVCDIDRSDPSAWTFRPAMHKGTWKGKGRTIYFGERCREALAPLILKAGGPEAYVFNPQHSEAERLAQRAEDRKTPRYASHMRRNEEKRAGTKRKRPPMERYTTTTYRRAVERACERAGVPVFTPHRLRHLAATRVRAELGVDAARALLGHSLASITEIYSHEVDKGLALKAVAKFG